MLSFSRPSRPNKRDGKSRDDADKNWDDMHDSSAVDSDVFCSKCGDFLGADLFAKYPRGTVVHADCHAQASKSKLASSSASSSSSSSSSGERRERGNNGHEDDKGGKQQKTTANKNKNNKLKGGFRINGDVERKLEEFVAALASKGDARAKTWSVFNQRRVVLAELHREEAEKQRMEKDIMRWDATRTAQEEEAQGYEARLQQLDESLRQVKREHRQVVVDRNEVEKGLRPLQARLLLHSYIDALSSTPVTDDAWDERIVECEAELANLRSPNPHALAAEEGMPVVLRGLSAWLSHQLLNNPLTATDETLQELKKQEKEARKAQFSVLTQLKKAKARKTELLVQARRRKNRQ
jgi:hypothetical protein